MYNFKLFDQTSKRYENRITVTGSMAFGFPTQFFKSNNIAQYKYVMLYYDSEKRAVGFKFTNLEEERHKFKIIRSKVGYGGSIIASSFFKANKLDSKLFKGRYEWKKEEIPGAGELFVIELKEREVS